MRRAVTLALLLAALAPQARAQEGEPLPLAERRRAVREGTHVFRRILADAELSPLDSFDALARSPKRTILIVLGDLNQIEKVPGGLEKFVRDGGAVLLASDRAVRKDSEARAQLLRIAGVTIQAETVVSQELTSCYKMLDYCPFLLPWVSTDPVVRSTQPFLFRNPEGGDDLRVATNTPSVLLPQRLRLPILATLATPPGRCLVESAEGRREAIRGYVYQPGSDVPDPTDIRNYPAFMVGGEVGAGRVLVLADHSVFINEMMLPLDVKNVEFTSNAIAWLQGENGLRDRALLVEDGRIETKFDIPVKSGTIPPAEALRLLFAKRNLLLAKGEEKLAELEDRGFYDNALIDWLARRGMPPGRLAYWSAGVATALLALLLLIRLAVRYRFSHDQTAPSLVSAVSGNFPSRSLAEQRNQALLRRNNLNEPAGALARHWFAGLGVEVPPGSAAPAFRVKGGWGERRRRARRLRALWELASGKSAAPVSAPQIWRLQREMEELAAAKGRGEWSVDQAEARQPARTAG